MDTLLPFALLCLTSFFTLTNPLGTMPVFLTMTQGMTEKERRFIVTRATLTAFIIIMVFTFASSASPPTVSASPADLSSSRLATTCCRHAIRP